MTREEIEKYVWDFLKSKNLADEVCSAIMGNIEAESEFNPSLVENGSGIGFGLIQWSFERRTALENYGTDLEHQCTFLWAELSGGDSSIGAEKQWINTKGYNYDDFIWNMYSIEEATSAFCWCFERPNEAYAHLDRRKKSANYYYNKFKGTGGEINNPVSENLVNKAVNWMIETANDDLHGYDQTNRWGPDYDCSSFIITGFEYAGIPLKSSGATYTGDMKQVAESIGFNVIVPDNWNDTSQFLKGDILLNEVHHVACYIGNGQIVHASINELGTATGGQTGDQTGKEICVRDYYIYSHGWDCILRYKYGGTETGKTSNGEVWNDITKTYYNVNQLTDKEIEFLKTLTYDSKIHMKFTFDRNKMFIGKSFFNSKLIFDEKEYKIKSVANNGYLQIYSNNKTFYKSINPKYIKE